MTRYAMKTSRVCAARVYFEIDDDGKLRDVSFMGGCDGQGKAVGKLSEGRPAQEVAQILSGNDCRGRGTSCGDQLAQAIADVMSGSPSRTAVIEG